MYENKIVRDYKNEKVTKEHLDACSTCDTNCVINDGLSDASKAALLSGQEKIVSLLREVRDYQKYR